VLTRRLTVGFLGTNCYLVTCEKTLEAIIIDPGFGADETENVLREITEKDLRLKYVVDTHGHADHVSGNGALKQATGAEILIHEDDAPLFADPWRNLSKMMGLTVASPPADQLLREGDLIRVGSSELEVMHTPGHTAGSISLHCASDGIVFTGDTLFAGSIGRTDLPGSSFEDIVGSLSRLMGLPAQTVVYPGHGEKTTIGKERRENPFVLG